jgi:hypothetical protein
MLGCEFRAHMGSIHEKEQMLKIPFYSPFNAVFLNYFVLISEC